MSSNSAQTGSGASSSSPPSSTTPNPPTSSSNIRTPQPQDSNAPVVIQQPEPPILILLYVRRPSEGPTVHYTPPILRGMSLERLAVYESHIRMIKHQLTAAFPSVLVVQVDIDLGFPFVALEQRLRSSFGGDVQEVRFGRGMAEGCTWDGEQQALKEVVRAYKVM